MSDIRSRVILLGMIILTVLSAGCASNAVVRNYYTLIPVHDGGSPDDAPRAPVDVCLSISSLEMPEYLDRPSIAIRNARNGVKYPDHERWAGSLHDDILRVLAENLSMRLHYATVLTGRRAHPVDYWIAMSIRQFDAVPNEKVYLKAIWSVYGKDRKTLVLRQETSVTEPVKGPGYGTIVAAMSTALGRLSSEVAGKLQATVLKK